MARLSFDSNLPFEEMIGSLVLDYPSSTRPQVLDLQEHLARLIQPEGGLLLVLRFLGEGPPPLEHLRSVALELSSSGGTLLVIGGDESLGAELHSLRPAAGRRLVRLVHLSESGHYQSILGPLLQGDHLKKSLSNLRVLSAQERDELRMLRNQDQRDLAIAAQFGQKLAAKTPRVTVALAAINLLIFLYFERVGHESKMLSGALYQPFVLDGQYFRLISAGFLHANLMHIGTNLFVLWVIGGQVERMIGSARYLCAYLLCLLASSTYSVMHLGQTFGLGASGAIAGLFGIEVMLTLGFPRIIPTALAARWRKIAFTNLGLNALISFLPNIDWRAHLAGLLMGAALCVVATYFPKSVEKRMPYQALAGASALVMAWGVLSMFKLLATY